jgi:hypothetical protein
MKRAFSRSNLLDHVLLVGQRHTETAGPAPGSVDVKVAPICKR